MLVLQSAPHPAPSLSAANEAAFVRKPARLYHVRYRLKNDTTGNLEVISRSQTGAMLRVLTMFGDQVRACSAKVQS